MLPENGNYGDGVMAQLVIVSNGARWIEERIYPLFPDAVFVLDAYHVLERFGKVAGEAFGVGTPAAQELQGLLGKSMGLREARPREPRRRKGHKKTRRQERVLPPVVASTSPTLRSRPGHIDTTVNALRAAPKEATKLPAAVSELVTFLDDNAYRLDFASYRARGIQIGSGAMESMHRFGSQLRAKRSGCRWGAENVFALIRLRLLAKVGRWNEFWSQVDFDGQLSHALNA